MMKWHKTKNKRMIARGRNGRFRKTTLSDLGFGEGNAHDIVDAINKEPDEGNLMASIMEIIKKSEVEER